jgi:hypothetical protein
MVDGGVAQVSRGECFAVFHWGVKFWASDWESERMNAKISLNSRQECGIAFAMSAEWAICAIENFFMLRSGDVDVSNSMD